MSPNIRAEIDIPDHEVLRKVGGGSYGEVWMARGVTGALRAAKVVWREDFEDERGFEREFEGILKFEPISRDHPGFVNILHVGRSDDGENSFYYYLMELGDDVHTGREINPVEYEARTLLSDLKASAGKPLEVGFCVDVGLRLAEALQHLHERDLAHRDVKPANVIFVEGKAKLADIGLVAQRGQQTFVGTEGFVPPEGPGSGQADIYSLGKVLYEMATGKDRLQFPELPDEIPDGVNRKHWMSLNEVICNICDPKLSKRTINSSKKLAEALAKIKQGKKVSQTNRKGVKRGIAALLLVAAGTGMYQWGPWGGGDSGSGPTVSKPPLVVVPNYQFDVCGIQFASDPAGAEVIGHLQDGYLETPTEFIDYPPGTELNLVFKLDGYRPQEKTFIVPDKQLDFVSETLDTFQPPMANKVWVDSVGARYYPRANGHESGYARKVYFNKFLKGSSDVDGFTFIKRSEKGKDVGMVIMTAITAEKYTAWLENEAKSQGLLEDDQYITFIQNPSLKFGAVNELIIKQKRDQFATRCVAKEIPYATIDLTSEPLGASVYIDGEWVGATPLELTELRPGRVQLELSLDGYKPNFQDLIVSESELLPLNIELEKNNGVVFGESWKNSLEIEMVPFADGKLVAVWEVRVSDYNKFRKATKYRKQANAFFPQRDDHPVVGVNKADAEAFCKWMTEKERREDRIREHHEYRLPTDKEWSLFCGLKNELGETPIERSYNSQQDDKLKDVYPWGEEFPPATAVSNIADKSAAKAVAISEDRTVKGYDDKFQNTAPVGSFAPNALGIYGLSGNVYEWVLDPYTSEGEVGVVRGGSWATFLEKDLKSWSRFAINNKVIDNQYGFRVVLVDMRRE